MRLSHATPCSPQRRLMTPADESAVLNLGTPGASARRKHESLQANRHTRTREKHPRIGGLMLALQDDPQHEQA